MVKELKNIDFYTTGKQLSDEDFKRISEWINQKKKRKIKQTKFQQRAKRTSFNTMLCYKNTNVHDTSF